MSKEGEGRWHWGEFTWGTKSALGLVLVKLNKFSFIPIIPIIEYLLFTASKFVDSWRYFVVGIFPTRSLFVLSNIVEVGCHDIHLVVVDLGDAEDRMHSVALDGDKFY